MRHRVPPLRAAPLHTRRGTPCTLPRRTVTHTPGHTVYPDAPSRRTSPCCAISRMLPCHAALHLCRAPHTEPNHAPLPRPAHRAQPRTFAAPCTPSPTMHLCRALHTESNHAPLPRPAVLRTPATSRDPATFCVSPLHSRYAVPRILPCHAALRLVPLPTSPSLHLTSRPAYTHRIAPAHALPRLVLSRRTTPPHLPHHAR